MRKLTKTPSMLVAILAALILLLAGCRPVTAPGATAPEAAAPEVAAPEVSAPAVNAPVSYTHLDVYKRQTSPLAMTSPTRTSGR